MLQKDEEERSLTLMDSVFPGSKTVKGRSEIISFDKQKGFKLDGGAFDRFQVLL